MVRGEDPKVVVEVGRDFASRGNGDEAPSVPGVGERGALCALLTHVLPVS